MFGDIKKGLLIFPILKDLNKADGILVKNEGIRKGFLENGVEVDTLEFNTRGIFNGNEQVYAFHPGRYRRIYQYNTTGWKRISEYAMTRNYDFIWFRIPMITGPVAQFIRNLRKNLPQCRIIIEYGAYPYVNELSGFKKFFYHLNKGNERKAHRHADFVITYCGQDQVDNLPNIPINNGIDLEGIPVNSANTSIAGRINFISVSSLKKWHAYERFIAGMQSYLRQPGAHPIHFNIVGNGPEYAKLADLTRELKLEDYVTFHNFKTGKELDAIYQENHIAVGTLGFHRIGITNSSSLKNREYFARGLPIVLSTLDLDMPPELPFVKYISEGEEPISIDEVVKFALDIYRTPALNRQIRQYAEEQVSWKSKVRTVLHYLKGTRQPSPDQSKIKMYS